MSDFLHVTPIANYWIVVYVLLLPWCLLSLIENKERAAKFFFVWLLITAVFVGSLD